MFISLKESDLGARLWDIRYGWGSLIRIDNYISDYNF